MITCCIQHEGNVCGPGIGTDAHPILRGWSHGHRCEKGKKGGEGERRTGGGHMMVMLVADSVVMKSQLAGNNGLRKRGLSKGRGRVYMYARGAGSQGGRGHNTIHK